MHDGVPYIKDLNSSNGTFINDISIANPSGQVGEPHKLCHLDIIVFGQDIPDDDRNDLFKKVVCKVIIVDQMDNHQMDNDQMDNEALNSREIRDFEKLSENEKLGKISGLITQELKAINDYKNSFEEYEPESVKKILELSQNQQSLKEFCHNGFREIKEKQKDLEQTLELHKVLQEKTDENTEISKLRNQVGDLNNVLELQKVLQEITDQNTNEIKKLKNQIKWTYQNLCIITLSLGGLFLLKKYSKL